MTQPELSELPRLDSVDACEDGNGTHQLRVHYWPKGEGEAAEFMEVSLPDTVRELLASSDALNPWRVLELAREVSTEQQKRMQDIAVPGLISVVYDCNNSWHQVDGVPTNPTAGPRREGIRRWILIRNGLGRMAVFPESVQVDVAGIGQARRDDNGQTVRVIEGDATLNELLLARQPWAGKGKSRVGVVQVWDDWHAVLHPGSWPVPHPGGIGDTAECLVYTDDLDDLPKPDEPEG